MLSSPSFQEKKVFWSSNMIRPPSECPLLTSAVQLVLTVCSELLQPRWNSLTNTFSKTTRWKKQDNLCRLKWLRRTVRSGQHWDIPQMIRSIQSSCVNFSTVNHRQLRACWACGSLHKPTNQVHVKNKHPWKGKQNKTSTFKVMERREI